MSDLDAVLNSITLDEKGDGGGLLKVDFERWPAKLRLKVDAERIRRRVGGPIATEVRRRIKRGMEAHGRALQKPGRSGATRGADGRFRRANGVGHGKPLDQTGSLIKSIKYRRGKIAPGGMRDDTRLDRPRQQGLLYVLIHTSDTREPRGRKIDPMGVDKPLAASVRKRARRALTKELARPGSGLVAEMKRLKPRR